MIPYNYERDYEVLTTKSAGCITYYVSAEGFRALIEAAANKQMVSYKDLPSPLLKQLKP